MRRIDYLIYHCTATLQTATLASIKNYWHNVLGWKVGGYHFIIMPDGKREVLYPLSTVTNGVQGFNSHAVHISFVGGIDTKGNAIDNRTFEQKEELLAVTNDVLIELKKYQPVDGILLRGHRDFSPDKNGNGIIDPWERIKECPCFDVIDEYGWVQGTKALNSKRLV